MANDPDKISLLIEQLIQQFPHFKPTNGFLVGLSTMFMVYSETVIREVINPIHGIAGHHKFFPSLAELKTFCEGVAERQERFRLKSATPLADHLVNSASGPEKRVVMPSRGVDANGSYIGPMDLVRPGDLIPGWRMEEYDLFMRSKGIQNVRHWGFNETWVDNQTRPFKLSANPVGCSAPDVSPPVPSPAGSSGDLASRAPYPPHHTE